MSSSQQQNKPKLPITPKLMKMGQSSRANVLQSKASPNNNLCRLESTSGTKRKPPRLDIVCSQTPPKRAKQQVNANIPSSPSKNGPSNPNDTNIWDDGHDDAFASINLEALENSFKENQVVKQSAPERLVNHGPPPITHSSTQQLAGNKIPNCNLKTTSISNRLNSGQNVNEHTIAISNGAASKSNEALVKKIQRLQSELIVKDGEAKNLRLELQKKEKHEFEMRKKLEEEKKNAMQEAEEKLKRLKSESDRRITELQFQSRDIADSKEKLKAKALMKETPGVLTKRNQTSNINRVLFEDIIQEFETTKDNINTQRKEQKIETCPELYVDIHVGKLLYSMLYPHLFDSLEQENESFGDYIESMKSCNVSTIKNVLSLTQTISKPETNQHKNKSLSCKNEASNKPSKMMSFSQLPFIPLYTMKSLGAESSHDLIKKIVLKCYKLLEKFLIILKGATKYDENYEKRVCKLATSCFDVAISMKNQYLLSSHRWYPDERGIEVRRAIAVLSALAGTSVHAVNLVLQTNFSEHDCNLTNILHHALTVTNDKRSAQDRNERTKRKPSTSSSPDQRKFPRLNYMEPSTSRMEVDSPRRMSPSSVRNSSNNEIILNENSKEEGKKTLGFLEKMDVLQTIYNIIAEINIQYRTISFNGILASVISLLKILADCDIPIERLNVINNIIKQVVFCCPGPAIIHDIISLMVQLAKYLPCTDSLCINSTQNSFIDSLKHYTFTTETCVLQVLCAECEMIEKTPVFAENFTKWALKLTLVNTSDCPNWLTGDCRMLTCDCFPRFIELFLNVLHYAVITYGDEERPISELSKNQLASVMRRGILVLNRIMLERNDFLSQVGNWDGLNEAIVHYFLQISKKIQFEAPIYDMLNDLNDLSCQQVQFEQASNSKITSQSQRLDNKVLDTLNLSCETVTERLPSSQSTAVNLQLNNPSKKKRKSTRRT